MEKDIIDIVTEKEFVELSAQEREELKEFCSSEEEFNQLKGVFIGVEAMGAETYTPKPETKKRLDDLFYESHPKAAPVWYSSVLAVLIPKEKKIHRQPLMQIAAVALLLILIVPFFSSDSLTADADYVAQEYTTTLEEDALTDDEAPVDESLEDPITNSQDAIVMPSDGVISNGVILNNISVIDITTTNGVAGSGSVDYAWTAAEPDFSDHPDGIFAGDVSGELALSQPASESTDLLDLLTATF
ncbi:MAG: hypothetical protein QNK23_18400 [Crocinitomicaceae bacterium]|nr:hypothetical protein [Crocinitomicaceae bacterium]